MSLKDIGKVEIDLKELKRLVNHILKGIDEEKSSYTANVRQLSYKTYIESILKEAISLLKREFPNKSKSWLLRAAIRFFFIIDDKGDEWILKGIPSFGDLYNFYRVRFSSRRGKYECSCYNTSFGNVRERRICTHIAAVIIYRKVKSLMTYYTQ